MRQTCEYAVQHEHGRPGRLTAVFWRTQVLIFWNGTSNDAVVHSTSWRPRQVLS